MNDTEIRNIIEAALLAAGKSLTLAELGQVFDDNARPDAAELRAAIEALSADYEGRAIEIKETGAGFRVQVRREYGAAVVRLWPERPQRYSRALLETLALIAYRQPITRAEIEAVRGVGVNPNIIRTLLERQWIRVVGHRDLPGRPELLGTTRDFLEYFSIRSLDELPPLAQLSSLGDLNPQLDLSVGPESVVGTESELDLGHSAEIADSSEDEAADADCDPDDYSAAPEVKVGLLAASIDPLD